MMLSRIRRPDFNAIALAARDWVAVHFYLTVGLVVSVVLFIAVVSALVVNRAVEISDQQDMAKQIVNFRRISETAATRAEGVEAQFDAVQQSFPSAELRETDVFKAVRELVAATGLNVNTVNLTLTSDNAKEKVGSTEYRVMTFSMKVGGDFDRVWDLIQRLDQGEGPFRTLVLDKTKFTLGRSSAAELVFKIYTLPAG